jgi:tetratricopeptide (TPR) repeat protein
MRRAALILPLLVAVSCGDGRSTQAAPPPTTQKAAAAPFDATFDDAQLEARVLDAARTGKTDGLSSLTLPPRCDRVRVAVAALHRVADAPPREGLLAALDALAKCQGGASANSLGPLVAAWRTWGDAQFAAERDLAARAAKCREAIKSEKRDAPFAALAGAPPAPPMSPAAAEIFCIRNLSISRSTPDNAVNDEIAKACEASRKLYEALGWPGGWAEFVDDVVLPPLLAHDSKSFLAAFFADSTRAAYTNSGDELRAALVFGEEADAAERDGDLPRAERAADAARQRLAPTGARGRELFDVLRRHGALAQKVGRQADAARDLKHAMDEAKYAGLDARTRVDVAEPLATSLFRLGRFDEAFAVAREASASDPSRVGLEEIAAESALELCRFADAADLFRAAAARGDARDRDGRLLFAARALAKGGDADGAAKVVAEVLARNGAPGVRVFAAGVLREANRLDDAERELTRAAMDGGAPIADMAVVERARIAVARGDAANARAYLGTVVDRLTRSDPDKLVGWDLAEPLLDWSRMEMGLGRLYEASELAGRAVIQLRGSGLEWELDKARKLYVELQRRRGWFVDAEKATTQRLAAQVGDLARKEDVQIDLLFIRIELLNQRRKDAETNARAAAATFPDDWRRGLATDAVDASLGRPPKSALAPPGALDVRSRWGLLRDLVGGKTPAEDIASRAGAEEPELRRWAASKRFGAGHDEYLVELRRRPDPTIPVDVSELMTREDEALLLVEPIGEKTIVRLLRKGRIVKADVAGDAGLTDFWDATWVAPSPQHLEAAAKRVSKDLFGDLVSVDLDGVRQLWISLPEPLGPLPFDLLPFKDQMLLDRFHVVTVNSLTELSRARERVATESPSILLSPYATLDAPCAYVAFDESVRDSASRRFDLLKNMLLLTSKDRLVALREQKLKWRAEWKPDPNRPSVPPWACFLLRGAP